MRDSIKIGVGIGFMLHLLQIPVFYSQGTFFRNGGLYVILMPVTQFLYMIPAAFIALALRKIKVAQGILLAAGITLLVGAATCGALIMGLGHAHRP